LGIRQRLALRDLADEPLALGREADDRGGGARALLVGDDLGGAPLHHRHAGVGGAQIDADDLTHGRPRRVASSPSLSPRISRAGALVYLLVGRRAAAVLVRL